MYQVDHTQSEFDNFLALINQGAQYPLKPEEFVRGIMIGVTPTPENFYANTRVVLEAANPVVPLERTQVIYARLDLLKNRPSAGFSVFCTNDDSHEDIHAKILERHRLIASEVEFVNPVRRPEAGESLGYVVNAKAGSYLYFGSMTIQARNTSEQLSDQVHPSYFFGNPVGSFNGRTLYAASSPMTMADDFDNGKWGKDIFFDFLNRIKRSDAPSDWEFNEGTFSVESKSANSSNETVVEVTPLDGSFLSTPFALRYTNVMLANRQFGGAPQELMNITHVPTLLQEVRAFLKLSFDEVKLTGLEPAPENNTTYRKVIAFTATQGGVPRAYNGYTMPAVFGYFTLTL